MGAGSRPATGARLPAPASPPLGLCTRTVTRVGRRLPDTVWGARGLPGGLRVRACVASDQGMSLARDSSLTTHKDLRVYGVLRTNPPTRTSNHSWWGWTGITTGSGLGKAPLNGIACTLTQWATGSVFLGLGSPSRVGYVERLRCCTVGGEHGWVGSMGWSETALEFGNACSRRSCES